MLLRRLLPALAALFLLVSLPFSTEGRDDKAPEKKDDKSKAKVNLTWKFDVKNKTPIYQKMVTKTEQKFTVMGNVVSQSQEQTFWFSWTPEKEEGDTLVLKQKVEGVKMNILIGNQKIDYDSTSKAGNENSPLNDFFKALLGAEFTVTLNKTTYKVVKIEGYKEFVDKLTKANPTMKPLLELILNEKALEQMVDPTFAVLPNKEVTEGEEWSPPARTLDMGPIGTYSNTYKYKYVGKDPANKALDKIEFSVSLKYDAPKDDKPGSTLPFKIKSADLSSKDSKGTLLYNAEKGWVESCDTTLTLEGTLNIEIGGQTTEVKINQTQNSKVETSDKRPPELGEKK